MQLIKSYLFVPICLFFDFYFFNVHRQLFRDLRISELLLLLKFFLSLYYSSKVEANATKQQIFTQLTSTFTSFSTLTSPFSSLTVIYKSVNQFQFRITFFLQHLPDL